MTMEGLGNRLHISCVAVRKRVKRLEQDGHIRGYHAVTHWDREAVALINLHIAQESVSDVVKTMTVQSQIRVRNIYLTDDGWLYVVAAAESSKIINTAVEKLFDEYGDVIVGKSIKWVKEDFSDFIN